MAIAIRLAGNDATAVVRTFAMNDLFMSNMEDAPMGARDDYYMAPFGMVAVPQRKRKGEDRVEDSYVLFTGYKVRDMHDRAWAACGNARGAMRLLSSLGDVIDGALGLKVPESKIRSFRRNAWAGGDDVSLALEDHVFAAVCKELGCEFMTVEDLNKLDRLKLPVSYGAPKRPNYRMQHTSKLATFCLSFDQHRST